METLPKCKMTFTEYFIQVTGGDLYSWRLLWYKHFKLSCTKLLSQDTPQQILGAAYTLSHSLGFYRRPLH